MDLQDGFATADVRKVYRDLAVKSTRTQQSGVEHIGTIGGRDDNDPFLSIEPIHFDQQRIKGLFTLVVSAAQPVTTTPPHGIDFVDENQTGGILASLFKHVSHAARPDANKHLHEIGPADAEDSSHG